MKVSQAIEGLKNFDPNADIFITWFDKDEFMYEFAEWADSEVEPITNDEWEGIVEGTTNDDRIAEAIMESMRYDFNKLLEQQQAKELSKLDKELWEK
jgi:hypothetical protein